LLLVSLVALPGCRGSYRPPVGPSPSVNEPPALKGIVRESGTQAPLAGARVCWSYPNCVLTGQDGSYRIVRSDPIGNCPYVDGQDFAGRQDCVTLIGSETTWNPTLSRTIRIEAGQTAAATIYSDDISGLQQEDYCVACKRIVIVAPSAGLLTVRLTPDNAGLRLAFGYTDQRSNEPYRVPAGRQSPVAVLTESPSAPRSFEVSTVFVPD
jgi:hypothetical protein